MKALWISLAATAILLLAWGLFINYANVNINNMVMDIDDAIVCAEKEDWQKAQDSITSVSRQWHDRRLIFSAFFDEISIRDTEASLLKADAYIRSEERGSALAELVTLRHLLLFLRENEMITIENIF